MKSPHAWLTAALVLTTIVGCEWIGAIGADGNDDEPYSLSSLDEKCHDKLTGEDLTGDIVLARTRSNYSAILEWRPEVDSMLAETVPLTIGTAYEGGQIICHPAMQAPPGTMMPDIRAFIEIALELEFVSEDGFFQETFAAMFDGYNFSKGFRPQDLSGRFRPDVPEWEDVRVNFSGILHGTETSGSIAVTGRPPGRVSTYSPFAHWNNWATPLSVD